MKKNVKLFEISYTSLTEIKLVPEITSIIKSCSPEDLIEVPKSRGMPVSNFDKSATYSLVDIIADSAPFYTCSPSADKFSVRFKFQDLNHPLAAQVVIEITFGWSNATGEFMGINRAFYATSLDSITQDNFEAFKGLVTYSEVYNGIA